MPAKLVELRTASAILRERLRQEEAVEQPSKGLIESLKLADRHLCQQIALRATPSAPSIEDLIFIFICCKYMIATYTDETRIICSGVHNLAHDLAEFFEQLQTPPEDQTQC